VFLIPQSQKPLTTRDMTCTNHTLTFENLKRGSFDEGVVVDTWFVHEGNCGKRAPSGLYGFVGPIDEYNAKTFTACDLQMWTVVTVSQRHGRLATPFRCSAKSDPDFGIGMVGHESSNV
jgi:hypothetical protein